MLFGGGGEPYHLLAEIAARQHVDERGRSRLETLGDRLAEFEAAGAEPFHQLVERLVAPRQVAADAEALQHDTLVEEDADVAQALTTFWAFAAVVLRDLSADRHARIHIEARQHGIEDVAADIVEIDVDTLRCGPGERGVDGARLVVDAVIEAEVGDDVAALLRPTGDADGAAAFDPRDLADDTADGTSRRRHDDRLAGLDSCNIDDTHHGR